MSTSLLRWLRIALLTGLLVSAPASAVPSITGSISVTERVNHQDDYSALGSQTTTGESTVRFTFTGRGFVSQGGAGAVYPTSAVIDHGWQQYDTPDGCRRYDVVSTVTSPDGQWLPNYWSVNVPWINRAIGRGVITDALPRPGAGAQVNIAYHDCAQPLPSPAGGDGAIPVTPLESEPPFSRSLIGYGCTRVELFPSRVPVVRTPAGTWRAVGTATAAPGCGASYEYTWDLTLSQPSAFCVLPPARLVRGATPRGAAAAVRRYGFAAALADVTHSADRRVPVGRVLRFVTPSGGRQVERCGARLRVDVRRG